MKGLPIALALVLVGSAARADGPDADKPVPFTYPKFVRTLVGVGGVPRISSPYLIFTGEIGGHPLTGALGTGFSFSAATSTSGLFTAVTPGIFAKLDLTYLFLTGFWTTPEPPAASFPFRLEVGSRLGLDITDSFLPADKVGFPGSYVLIRPAFHSFVDFEYLLGKERKYAAVARGAVDTSVDLSDVFRWSVSLGLAYGWGRE